MCEVIEVWPENWPAFNLFNKVSTQWRDNGYDPVGLDYTPLFYLMRRMNLSDQEWDDLFEAVQILEAEAVKTMRENR